MSEQKKPFSIMVVIGEEPKPARRMAAGGYPAEPDDDEEDDTDDDDDEPGSPEEAENRRVVHEAAEALRGKHGKPDEAINEFIETFGRGELDYLRSLVRPDPIRAATGRLIQGPGRGMQDRIPAQAGDQPVLLSDGEFVVPADVVSMLGDGSTDAGVRVLEAMIDRVRQSKTGTGEQASEIDLDDVMPI